MLTRIARPILAALALAFALVLGACGVGYYRPGYVYYDGYGAPYTYAYYGGYYHPVYVPREQVYSRGGVALVTPGYNAWRRPYVGVSVAPRVGFGGGWHGGGFGGGRGAVGVHGR